MQLMPGKHNKIGHYQPTKEMLFEWCSPGGPIAAPDLSGWVHMLCYSIQLRWLTQSNVTDILNLRQICQEAGVKVNKLPNIKCCITGNLANTCKREKKSLTLCLLLMIFVI